MRIRSKAALRKDEAHEMYRYERTGSYTRPGEWFQAEMFLRLTEGLCRLRMRGYTVVDMQSCQLPYAVESHRGPLFLSFKYLSTQYFSPQIYPAFWKELNSNGHKSGNVFGLIIVTYTLTFKMWTDNPTGTNWNPSMRFLNDNLPLGSMKLMVPHLGTLTGGL